MLRRGAAAHQWLGSPTGEGWADRLALVAPCHHAKVLLESGDAQRPAYRVPQVKRDNRKNDSCLSQLCAQGVEGVEARLAAETTADDALVPVHVANRLARQSAVKVEDGDGGGRERDGREGERVDKAGFR